MTRKLLHLTFLAFASFSQAAPNVCPQASLIATALSKASISVTPFCSSFLGIPTKSTTLTVTSTPSPTTVDSTSTVQSVTIDTTLVTSTVTTTVSTATLTTYSIDGSNKKRGLASGQRIPNPVESDVLNKRKITTTSSTSTKPAGTPIIPSALSAFASSIISSGCACLSIPTPTQTFTASTTLPKITSTRIVTTTVVVSTTTTQVIDRTASATATNTAVIDVCAPSNNYGVIYSGGYAALSPSQSGVSATSTVVSSATSNQACCAACYQTPACYLYYLSNNACTLVLTTGGSSTAATAQCPSGQLDEFPASDDPSQALFGIGACANFVGLSG